MSRSGHEVTLLSKIYCKTDFKSFFLKPKRRRSAAVRLLTDSKGPVVVLWFVVLWFVVLWFVVLWFVVLWFVVCGLLFVVCCLLFVVCCFLYVCVVLNC